MSEKTFVIDEFELAGELVQVTVVVEANLYGAEYRAFEGHGVVCTMGQHAAIVDAVLVAVDGEAATVAQREDFRAAWDAWLDENEQFILERVG